MITHKQKVIVSAKQCFSSESLFYHHGIACMTTTYINIINVQFLKHNSNPAFLWPLLTAVIKIHGLFSHLPGLTVSPQPSQAAPSDPAQGRSSQRLAASSLPQQPHRPALLHTQAF